MAECGESGSGSSRDSLDKSITLPPDEIFRNLENAKRFAIDIGSGGRAPGAGRRAVAWARVAGPAGRGGGKDERRGVGSSAHSLSGLVVRGPPAPTLAGATGLQLPAGAARQARGMPGLVVPREQPCCRVGTPPRDGRLPGPGQAQSPLGPPAALLLEGWRLAGVATSAGVGPQGSPRPRPRPASPCHG